MTDEEIAEKTLRAFIPRTRIIAPKGTKVPMVKVWRVAVADEAAVFSLPEDEIVGTAVMANDTRVYYTLTELGWVPQPTFHTPRDNKYHKH